ncbi:hypothetical protein D0865_12975 [Hortaea werneckii]|uniref:Uncharacterized protein n=1 Tax=Hortaea werneckii TaxID=91943 RepID=A0A3M7BGH4_HORWE|nr:hypothetical protein D0865_12975 [Hortaea werneckii]
MPPPVFCILARCCITHAVTPRLASNSNNIKDTSDIPSRGCCPIKTLPLVVCERQCWPSVVSRRACRLPGPYLVW